MANEDLSVQIKSVLNKIQKPESFNMTPDQIRSIYEKGAVEALARSGNGNPSEAALTSTIRSMAVEHGFPSTIFQEPVQSQIQTPEDFNTIINENFHSNRSRSFIPVFKAAIQGREEEFQQFAQAQASAKNVLLSNPEDAYTLAHAIGATNFVQSRTSLGPQIDFAQVYQSAQILAANEQAVTTSLITQGNRDQSFGGSLSERYQKSVQTLAKSKNVTIPQITKLSKETASLSENPEFYTQSQVLEDVLQSHAESLGMLPFSTEEVQTVAQMASQQTGTPFYPIRSAVSSRVEAERQQRQIETQVVRNQKRQEKEDAKKLTVVGAAREYALSGKPINYENINKYLSKNEEQITDLNGMSPLDFGSAVLERHAGLTYPGVNVNTELTVSNFGPGITTNLRKEVVPEGLRLNRFEDQVSKFKTYGEVFDFGSQLGLEETSYGPIYEQHLEQQIREKIVNDQKLNNNQKTQVTSKIADIIDRMKLNPSEYLTTAMSSVTSGLFQETQEDKNAKMMATNLSRPTLPGINALLEKTGAEESILPEYLKNQYELRNGDLTKEESSKFGSFTTDYLAGKETGNFFESGEDYLKYGPTKPGLAGIPRNFMSAAGKIGPFGAASFGWHVMSAVEKGVAPTLQGISQIPGESAAVGGTEALGTGAGLALGLATGNPIAGIVGSEIGGAAGRMSGSWLESHVYGPEKYGQQQGYGAGSTDAVKAFADALRTTATPAIKELGETVGKASQQFGTATKEGASKQAEAFAKLQFGEGVQYEPIQAAFNNYLGKNPLLAGVANTFTTNGLSKKDFENIAGIAAIQGDMSGVQAAMAQAQGNRPTVNANSGFGTKVFGVGGLITDIGSAVSLLGGPITGSFAGNFLNSDALKGGRGSEYEQIYKSLGGTSQGSLFTGEGWSNLGKRVQADWTQVTGGTYSSEADKKEQARQEALSQKLQSISIGQTQAKGGMEESLAKIAEIQSGIQKQILSGAGPEVYSNAQSKLENATADASGRLTTAINVGKSRLTELSKEDQKNPGVVALTALTQQNIAEWSSQLNQLSVTVAENLKTSLTASLSTQMAQLGALTASAQYDVTRATISQGPVSGIYQANVAVANSEESLAQALIQFSKSPIVTPEEKAKALTQADQSRAQAAQIKYEARMQQAGYAVSVAGVGVTQAEMVSRVASVKGTPEEIGKAITDIGPKLAASLDSLNKKLNVAATIDKPPIENQIAQTKAEQTLIPFQAMQAKFEAQSNITQAIIGGQGAQLSWTLATKGTGSESDKAYATIIESYKPAIAAAKEVMASFPKGSEGWQKAQEAVLSLTTAQSFATVQQGAYVPSAALSTQQIQWEGMATRMGYGFADKGNRNDIYQGLMSTYSTEEKQNTAKYQKWLKDNPNASQDTIDAEKYQYEQREQGLLTSKAQAAYQLDTQFGQNIQTLLIGGSSSTARYMPSRAQLAMGLETQRPGSAARVTGFYKPSSGDLATMGDQGYLAPGLNAASAQPGNWSLDALAKAVAQGVVVGLTNATLKLDQGNSSRPVPAKLTNTAVYNSSIVSNTLPGTSVTQ